MQRLHVQGMNILNFQGIGRATTTRSGDEYTRQDIWGNRHHEPNRWRHVYFTLRLFEYLSKSIYQLTYQHIYISSAIKYYVLVVWATIGNILTNA